MSEKLFDRMLARRSAVCFFVVCFLMLSCILRAAVVALGNYGELQAKQSSQRINISRPRGTIYDCNMVPLTNKETEIYAAVLPTPRAIVAISSVLEGDELAAALKPLNAGKPTVCKVPERIECEGISCSEVAVNVPKGYDACHLIGYLDDSGHGVSGLERAYDEILFSENLISASFETDGKGRVLYSEPKIENDRLKVFDGVQTTVDIKLQNAVERAAEGLISGAVIVADVKSAEIKAMVSYPQFDISDIAQSLNAANAPLINKCLEAFSVGSVFKPCVAAAAIEAGVADYSFNCKGRTLIVDRYFNCHKLDGHGILSLSSALAQSCNCYFYNLSNRVGGEAVFNMASSLNFGSKIQVAWDMFSKSGNLTSLKRLDNEATLANLSIGQGDLSLSPAAMLTLYISIANGGQYRLPSLVKGVVENGKTIEKEENVKTRAMSAKTAGRVKEYLKAVVTEGTGIEAMPKTTTAAGKTATAQTGRFDESGNEITNSWFCGFFPFEEPKYAVIVMSEGGSQIGTASIFSMIADNITKLQK